ncbi:hypothetical protein F4810DRAFT_711118 [Camillea tinctor]|nr:hypothetical protein F4810DRAFT_711118 [Camillea tinctor]
MPRDESVKRCGRGSCIAFPPAGMLHCGKCHRDLAKAQFFPRMQRVHRSADRRCEDCYFGRTPSRSVDEVPGPRLFRPPDLRTNSQTSPPRPTSSAPNRMQGRRAPAPGPNRTFPPPGGPSSSSSPGIPPTEWSRMQAVVDRAARRASREARSLGVPHAGKIRDAMAIYEDVSRRGIGEPDVGTSTGDAFLDEVISRTAAATAARMLSLPPDVVDALAPPRRIGEKSRRGPRSNNDEEEEKKEGKKKEREKEKEGVVAEGDPWRYYAYSCSSCGGGWASRAGRDCEIAFSVMSLDLDLGSD